MLENNQSSEMEDFQKEFEKFKTAGSLMDDVTPEEMENVKEAYWLNTDNSTLHRMDKVVKFDCSRTLADSEDLTDDHISFLGGE